MENEIPIIPITGILKKSTDYNSINYGISGTGPLISLAIIKEYGEKFVPKNVFYLYYEGNDIKDMMNEKDKMCIDREKLGEEYKKDESMEEV